MTLRTGAIHHPPPPAIQPLHARATLPATTGRNWFDRCPADNNPLGNDTLGVCVPVADERYIETVLANADGSDLWKPTLDAVLRRYAALTGFNPATGQPDDGTDTSADLVSWCRAGIALPELQRVIVPFWCSVDPKRLDHVAAALEIAPCLVTINLQVDWQDIETDASAWGGSPGALTGEFHRVLLGAPFVLRSWGMDITVSPDWWDACVVAVDCLLVRDLVPAEAVDWDALEADMKALAA